ncbi:MAG: rare lipoprotein A [Alphaproteobacteria bacterium]
MVVGVSAMTARAANSMTSESISVATLFRSAALCVVAVLLSACSSGSHRVDGDRQKEITYSPRVVSYGQRVPKGGGRFKLGRPYQVGGKTYTPRREPNYSRTGIASWYGKDFHGRLTANGEVYDMHALTAAHPTLPLPSMVEVTNTRTGRRVTLRVNDRGPFAHGRIIDLSHRAAQELGLARSGVGEVHVRFLGPAPL